LSFSPIISVVIPCYNHGHYLADAIGSVKDCPESIYEIIVVNDGSTSVDTQRILKELKAEGIQVIDQENAGVSKARNTGIAAAKGKYIFTLDADNKVYPNYLLRGKEILDTMPEVGVVYADAHIFGEKGGTWVNHPLKYEEIAFENYIDNCAMFRKAVWEQVGGYDENAPYATREDYMFWLDAIRFGWEFYHLNEFAFAYRFQQNSKVRKFFKDPEKRLAVTDYLWKKQSTLLKYLLETKKLSQVKADEITGKLLLQLGSYYIRFGHKSIGLAYIIKAMKKPGFKIPGLRTIAASFWKRYLGK